MGERVAEDAALHSARLFESSIASRTALPRPKERTPPARRSSRDRPWPGALGGGNGQPLGRDADEREHPPPGDGRCPVRSPHLDEIGHRRAVSKDLAACAAGDLADVGSTTKRAGSISTRATSRRALSGARSRSGRGYPGRVGVLRAPPGWPGPPRARGRGARPVDGAQDRVAALERGAEGGVKLRRARAPSRTPRWPRPGNTKTGRVAAETLAVRVKAVVYPRRASDPRAAAAAPAPRRKPRAGEQRRDPRRRATRRRPRLAPCGGGLRTRLRSPSGVASENAPNGGGGRLDPFHDHVRAFVPPKPNALTPARSGSVSSAGHARRFRDDLDLRPRNRCAGWASRS